MDRRDLLKGAIALPIVAAVPSFAVASAVSPMTMHEALHKLSVDMMLDVVRNPSQEWGTDFIKISDAMANKATEYGGMCVFIPGNSNETFIDLSESYYLYWKDGPSGANNRMYRADLAIKGKVVHWTINPDNFTWRKDSSGIYRLIELTPSV